MLLKALQIIGKWLSCCRSDDMNKEEMFNRLVENGLDFLFQAIAELEDKPKYSVINFYTAVELFVKARLMHEHWSLVVSKEPDLTKFLSGDFHSVSLHEASKRLKNIVGNGLSKEELKAFQSIGKHRNKMVHFFHEASSVDSKEEYIRSIVKEQLKAWYFLHQLLTVKWKGEFSTWRDKIEELDVLLKKHHEFLQVIFDEISPKIKEMEGYLANGCSSCGIEAQMFSEEQETVYDAICLVCGFKQKCLDIECEDCGGNVYFVDEGFASCEDCNKVYEPEDVANVIKDSHAEYVAGKEGSDTSGSCSNCESYNTVVLTKNDEWVCASCFSVFDSLNPCGYCNHLNSGNMEDSYALGCYLCEGMAGRHRDD